MSMGDECTTGGSQQRQLVKTLISLSLSDLSLSLSLSLSISLSFSHPFSLYLYTNFPAVLFYV